jgi:nitrogen fixation NifU-like protein
MKGILSVIQAGLYQQALLAHHKAPIGFELDIEISSSAEGFNAACGDEILVALEIKYSGGQQQVKYIAFHGDSCAICRASASMLCQHLSGYSLEKVSGMAQQVIQSIKGNVELTEEYCEIFSPLIAVQQFPVRKQCALLPWTTLLSAIASIEQ